MTSRKQFAKLKTPYEGWLSNAEEHAVTISSPETTGRRVLICGSREWRDIGPIDAMVSQLAPALIIAGGARGADSLAQLVAQRRRIPFQLFRARWSVYGLLAGRIRNQQMLVLGKPDIVVAFWNSKSTGTADMIARARRAGVSVIVVRPQSSMEEAP